MALLLAKWVWAAITLLPITVSDVNGVAVRPLERRGGPTVLVFVATDCPISNGYAPELQRIMAEHRGDGTEIDLVYCDATADQAKAHMAAYGYIGRALLDPNHALSARLGAHVTPEVAVLDDQGHLVYRGRIDDRYVDFGRKRQVATTHDLQAALDAVLAGRPVSMPMTRAIGCPIE